MKKFIFIDESQRTEYTISLMLDRIRGEKESVVNVGTVGHIDHGVDHLTIDTTMKHDCFNELNLTPDTVDEIKRLNKIAGYIGDLSICVTGHESMFDSLTDLIIDTDSPECLGNFKKVTKGNRHTYPHWFQGKY